MDNRTTSRLTWYYSTNIVPQYKLTNMLEGQQTCVCVCVPVSLRGRPRQAPGQAVQEVTPPRKPDKPTNVMSMQLMSPHFLLAHPYTNTLPVNANKKNRTLTITSTIYISYNANMIFYIFIVFLIRFWLASKRKLYKWYNCTLSCIQKQPVAQSK